MYERLTPPGRKPTFMTLLTTQLVSGLWHGLYPGYILFFAASALFFAQSTVVYKWEQVWGAGVVFLCLLLLLLLLLLLCASPPRSLSLSLHTQQQKPKTNQQTKQN